MSCWSSSVCTCSASHQWLLCVWCWVEGNCLYVALCNTLFLPLSPSLPLHAFLHLTRHLHVPLISFDVANYRVALEFRRLWSAQPAFHHVHVVLPVVVWGASEWFGPPCTLCTLLSGEALHIVDGLASVYTPLPSPYCTVLCLPPLQLLFCLYQQLVSTHECFTTRSLKAAQSSLLWGVRKLCWPPAEPLL